MSEAAWRLALLLSWARMKEGLFSMQVTLLYVFLYGFDGKLGLHSYNAVIPTKAGIYYCANVEFEWMPDTRTRA